MDESATSDAAPRRETPSSGVHRRRSTTPWAWLAVGVAASLGVVGLGHSRSASVRDAAPFIDVVGTVTFDPQRVAAVRSRIRGRVIDVSVVEGDAVAQWDVLAQLESAEVETARQRVHPPDGKAAEKRRFSLRSPIDGEVVGVHVKSGENVEPSLTAFRVADLSEIWVELTVFERDRASVAVGDTVHIEPLGGGGPSVPGVVAHVGGVLDRAARTFAVRVVVDNQQRRFAIGQAVQARFHAKRLALRSVLLR